jgi:hypothetical protein
MGMGLAGLGVVFSVIGGILQWKEDSKKAQPYKAEQETHQILNQAFKHATP